jgi:hypothetical protein
MPRTFMNRHLEEKQRLVPDYDPRSGDIVFKQQKVVDGTIPPLPELEAPLGPEGRASWDLDWRNLCAYVRHGLELRQVLRAIVERHREEGEPEVELSSNPRERAAQVVTILQPWRDRYQPILTAIREWVTALSTLRRFQNGVGTPNIGGAVDNAFRALHRPLHALGSLPEAPETVDPEDIRSLEAALNVAKAVKGAVEEFGSAPAAFRQALHGVIDTFDRLRDAIEWNDRNGAIDGVVLNSWGTTPPPYPRPVIDFIPQGASGDEIRRYETSVWP